MHSGPMWKVETTNVKVKGPASIPRKQVIEDDVVMSMLIRIIMY